MPIAYCTLDNTYKRELADPVFILRPPGPLADLAKAILRFYKDERGERRRAKEVVSLSLRCGESRNVV